MRGFTLVELSIVLVIIGLVIGGILIGQSLISSAKISTFISSIEQYNGAVGAFKAKYKNLPGDAKVFESSANNNGLIEDGLIDCCTASYTTEYKGENQNFWAELQLSGLKIPGVKSQIPIGVSGTPVIASGTNQNVPRANIGDNSAIIPFVVMIDIPVGALAFGSGTVVMAEALPKTNYFFITDFAQTVTDNTYQLSSAGNAVRRWKDSIPVDQAQGVDAKMDDGKPNAGIVLNGSYLTSDCWPAGSNTSSGRYDVSGGGKCSIMIKMQAAR